jgi:hypothetical protein
MPLVLTTVDVCGLAAAVFGGVLVPTGLGLATGVGVRGGLVDGAPGLLGDRWRTGFLPPSPALVEVLLAF